MSTHTHTEYRDNIWSHSSLSFFSLPFFCCSLIHFSSAHHGCVSRATGTACTALCKDIVLLSCAQTALTQTLWCIVQYTSVCSFTHKPSSGVNEVLEFLKTPAVRDRLCFIHPPVLLQLLTSSCQFCMRVPFLAATPHLTLVADQSWFWISSWGQRSTQLTEQQYTRNWKQYTCSMFQAVSSYQSIILLDVWIQDVWFGICVCVVFFFLCLQQSNTISTVMSRSYFMLTESQIEPQERQKWSWKKVIPSVLIYNTLTQLICCLNIANTIHNLTTALKQKKNCNLTASVGVKKNT